MKEIESLSTDELRSLNAITQLANFIAETVPGDPQIFLKQVNAAISITGISKLEHVWPNIALWMLSDPDLGLIRLCSDKQDVIDVMSTLEAHLAGSCIPPGHWQFVAKQAHTSGMARLGEDYDLTSGDLKGPIKGRKHFRWCASFVGFCLAASMLPFSEKDIQIEGERGQYIKHALFFHSWPVGAANISSQQRTKLFELILGKELSG